MDVFAQTSAVLASRQTIASWKIRSTWSGWKLGAWLLWLTVSIQASVTHGYLWGLTSANSMKWTPWLCGLWLTDRSRLTICTHREQCTVKVIRTPSLCFTFPVLNLLCSVNLLDHLSLKKKKSTNTLEICLKVLKKTTEFTFSFLNLRWYIGRLREVVN